MPTLSGRAAVPNVGAVRQAVRVPQDRNGRWRADDNEPFNAGLGGFSSEHFRGETPSNGCAIAMGWAGGLACLALGVIGPSIILFGIGCLLIGLAAPFSFRRLRARVRRRRPT